VTLILPARKVVLESPFRSTETTTIEQNRCYLGHCLEDCRSRREIWYASHAGLTGEDDDELVRLIGIRDGWTIGETMEYCVVYSDLGVTPGMKMSIDHYSAKGMEIKWRRLDPKLVKSILEM